MEEIPPTSTQFVMGLPPRTGSRNQDLHLEHNLSSQSHQPSLIIDSTSSRFTISLFASFIVVIISSFIICGFLPSVHRIIKKSESKCPNPTRILPNSSIQCTDFDISKNPKRGMLVKGLSEENQYLITNTNFFLVDPDVQTVLKGNVKFDQYKIHEQDDDDKVENGIISTQVPYEVNSTTTDSKIYSGQANLLGLQHKLSYQHTIVSANQLFIIDFQNLSQQPNIKNVTLEVLFINSSFTKFSIGLRIAFFAVSLAACVLYISRYRAMDTSKRVLEHKLIIVLSVLLVLFNNPLIILAFKGQRDFLVFFTQLTSILLPVFLMFFWICTFERGDTENTLHSSKVLRDPFKWILLVVLLAFELAVYLYKAYHHLLDYVGNPYGDPKPLVVLDYLAFGISVICLIFILLRSINIFRNTETMSRYRVLVVISSFFIIFLALSLFSESFYIFSIQPKSIFLVVIFMNLYVFYLQVLYQPIKYALVRPTSMKQLINDNVPTSYNNPQPLKIISDQYPPSHAPKLSTIVERSVEQSVGMFSVSDKIEISPKEVNSENLDNFQIGEPEVAPAKISRVTLRNIHVIEQENQEQEIPSQDLNSEKNIESSLVKSNEESDSNKQQD